MPAAPAIRPSAEAEKVPEVPVVTKSPAAQEIKKVAQQALPQPEVPVVVMPLPEKLPEPMSPSLITNKKPEQDMLPVTLVMPTQSADTNRLDKPLANAPLMPSAEVKVPVVAASTSAAQEKVPNTINANQINANNQMLSSSSDLNSNNTGDETKPSLNSTDAPVKYSRTTKSKRSRPTVKSHNGASSKRSGGNKFRPKSNRRSRPTTSAPILSDDAAMLEQ